MISNAPQSFKGRTFDDIHKEYSIKYGIKWFNMNRALIRAADGIGVDFTTPENKLLITVMAARALDITAIEVEARGGEFQ